MGSANVYPGACRTYVSLTFFLFFHPLEFMYQSVQRKAKAAWTIQNALPSSALALAVCSSWNASCLSPFFLTTRNPPNIQSFPYYCWSNLRSPFYLLKNFFASLVLIVNHIVSCLVICFRHITSFSQVRYKLPQDRNYQQQILDCFGIGRECPV